MLRRLDPCPLFEARRNLTWTASGKPVRWEQLVYNAAAVRFQGTTYVLYRALGDDGVSRLGLWWSKDGITQSGRLDHPVFAPEIPYEMPPDPDSRRTEQLDKFGMIREVGGVEDPRLVLVDGTLYMTYTAYSDIPRLAMAHMEADRFCAMAQNENGYSLWKSQWKRIGVVFAGYEDKNGYLLPEKHKDQWCLYHRIAPNIQLVCFDQLLFPVENTGATVMRPRAGGWDSTKIGGGAPPLKTEAGWLHVYHGVQTIAGKPRYCLGVYLTPLHDPYAVIYRSDSPLLWPQRACEEQGWVPNVVFTCGVVPATKDTNSTLSLGDKVMVYYGGADEVMCCAVATVGQLLKRA